MAQPGFFDFEKGQECSLSKDGDPLVLLAAHVDFEMFRSPLVKVLNFSRDRVGRGRPCMIQSSCLRF